MYMIFVAHKLLFPHTKNVIILTNSKITNNVNSVSKYWLSI